MKDRTCTIAECDRKTVARGLCRNHYRAAGFDTTHGTPTLRTATCTICKAEFTKTTTNTKRMLNCSPECARISQSLTARTNYPTCKVHLKHCDECGDLFAARRKSTPRCSERCNVEYFRARWRHQYQQRAFDRPDRLCKRCAKAIIPSTRQFCSECVNQARREAHANAQQARRARLSGVKRDRIVRLAVFTRDNWTCGICHETVEVARTYPDAMSASLDHVMPLAKGGTHTMNNVQLAHFICNSRKRDLLPAAC